MRLWNQTRYDTEWLRERIVFGLGRAHPTMVRVQYLPHPAWRDDVTHFAGRTNRRGVESLNWPSAHTIDLYVPYRMDMAFRHRMVGLSDTEIGWCNDEEILVAIAAHEAEHGRQTAWTRQQWYEDEELPCDLRSVDAVKAWRAR